MIYNFFKKMKKEEIRDVIDLMMFRLRVSLVMSYGFKQLKKKEIVYALHFLEHLKERDDDKIFFIKEDIDKIFLKNDSLEMALQDREDALSLLTGDYCEHILMKTFFGYYLNVSVFCALREFSSDPKKVLDYLYKDMELYVSDYEDA